MSETLLYTREKKVFRYAMALSFVLLLLPSQWTERVDHFIRFAIAPLSGPSRSLSLAVTDSLRRCGQGVPLEKYVALEDAYRQSQTRCANLTEELRAQRDWTAELAGLRQDYGLSRCVLIDANVIGADTGARQLLTLNQGSLNRVAPGQIVLTATRWTELQNETPVDYYQMSVVGRIAAAGLKTATLQLLDDPRFRLAVEILPGPDRQDAWRTNGVLQGGNSSQVWVTMVNSTVPVQPGDIVVAKAQKESLPIPMVVGTVTLCRYDDRSPMTWHIVVEPIADLNHLARVVIIDTNRDE